MQLRLPAFKLHGVKAASWSPTCSWLQLRRCLLFTTPCSPQRCGPGSLPLLLFMTNSPEISAPIGSYFKPLGKKYEQWSLPDKMSMLQAAYVWAVGLPANSMLDVSADHCILHQP